MGSSQSVNNEPIGKLIFNKIYETKIPVHIGRYAGYEKLTIQKYRNDIAMLNPNVGAFWIKHEPGLRFVVKNIQHRSGIDCGTCVDISVTLVDDLNSQKSELMEGIYSTNNRHHNADWRYTSVQNSESHLLKSLLSDDKKTIKLKKKEAKLDSYFFLKNTILSIDGGIPYEFHDTLLKYIGKNKDESFVISDNDIKKAEEYTRKSYIFWICIICTIIICIYFYMNIHVS